MCKPVKLLLNYIFAIIQIRSKSKQEMFHFIQISINQYNVSYKIACIYIKSKLYQILSAFCTFLY